MPNLRVSLQRVAWWKFELPFILLAFVAGCCSASTAYAQTVRVANPSAAPFNGWLRTTVDTLPPLPAGQLADGTRYVLGRRTGLDVWALDLHVAIADGQTRTVALAGATAWLPPPLTLPGDPLAYFGGWLTFGGVPMSIVSLVQDGAAWSLHARSRVGRLFVADCWLDWRPDEPGLMVGECTVTASNPAVPDVLETVPVGGYGLRWGAATVWGSEVCPAGTTFADGQARTLPVVIAWSEHVANNQQWVQVGAAVNRATGVIDQRGTIGAVGIARLLPGGNPRLPSPFSAAAWTQERWPAALQVATTWGPAVTGPSRRSDDTGGQEDQVFVRGECMAGVGPEIVAYLSALKLAARPNHYLQPNGSPIEPSEKPGAQFFDSRPHQSTGDLFGKSRPITPDDTNGWFGPDSQHWLANGLVAAARLTGSRALQAELSQQARLFLWQEALPSQHPGWFTTGFDSARSVGWTMLLACHLWQNLEDRSLADRVKARATARILEVYAPAFTGKDIWDVRLDDPRLGAGAWWQPWQQSIGVYGLDVAGEMFGVPAARTMALRGAKKVLADGWRLVGGKWLAIPDSPVAGNGVVNGGFNLFGMPLAVATVLRQEPQNVQARAIWTQLLADATDPGQLSWLPPEIVLQPAEPPATGATTVSQWGVTWTFASARQVGQFCNGDWWVVGPVTVTSIDPPCVVSNGRTINGSMINPPMTGEAGYDSALYANYAGGDHVYVASLNVARSMPLVVTAQSSLVSTISQIGPDPSGSASEIRTAAVLTVLSAPPPADAFRPPYCGSIKTIWRESQLDYGSLATLTPAPGGPTLTDCKAQFDRVWLDHCPHWTSGHIHPVLNMPSYYRDFTTWEGNAALRLNCNYTNAQKRDLLVRFVQLGIDWYGQYRVQTEPWGVNGHCNGRKFPILFAGKVLGDAGMLAVGVDHPLRFFGPDNPQNVVPWWSEDGQTFYVAETSPGVMNWGYGGYTMADVGLPEWGNFHAGGHGYDSAADSKAWEANSYRRCCSATSWVGVTLAMRAMGLRDAWNQPAFFDYMDRYEATPPLPGEDWTLAWEPWQGAMWRQHRGSL